jgi:hypothetical protein
VARLTPEPLTDRDALAAHLAEAGAGDDAARIAAAAELALQLVPPAPGAPPPRSHLGGPALLPAGHGWPRDRRGRALSFLAALDLAELPAYDGRDDLPPDGRLLFFADIANLDAEGLVEEEPAAEGNRARLLYAREPVAAQEPADLLADANNVLRRRPVVARPALAVPHDYEAAARLGVDDAALDRAHSALDELYGEGLWRAPELAGDEDDELWGQDEEDADPPLDEDDRWLDAGVAPRTEEALVAAGWRPPDDGRSLAAAHWVGGPHSGVQGHPPEPGTSLLLHLAFDEALGFLFLDGGALQFRIDPAAARAGEWSRAIACPDSG